MNYKKVPEIIEKLSSNIWERYDTIFEHSWNMWDSREMQVIKFLQKVFPAKYWFKSWEIFDKNWDTSWQVDIIIYDSLNSLIFTDWSRKIIAPMDSTYWVFEVKSTLTTSTLTDSLNKINKYSNLYRTLPNENILILWPYQQIEMWKWISSNYKFHNIPLNIIFAYDNNVAKETLLKEMKNNWNIDLVIIHNKLICFWRKRKDFWLSNSDWNDMEYYYTEWDNVIWLAILYIQTLLPKICLTWIKNEDIFLNYMKKMDYTILQKH